MKSIRTTFTKDPIDYVRELARIDNIHDFYKGSRVAQSILAKVRSKLDSYDPKGIFTSFTLPEDQTVDFFEKTFKTELNTNSHKEITFQDIIDDYGTGTGTGKKLLGELQFCDCLKIEFEDGQSLATTSSENIKKIGEFIVKFMSKSNDNDNISDEELTHFTFDGNSGSLSAIMLELKYCINLIIPQNIADSASTTLSHFGPRNYFYFPTNDGNEYLYESNILSITPMKLINKGYSAKKRHFDFVISNDNNKASYNDQYRQGPGVAYLASLIGECVDGRAYTNVPNLSTVLNINDLLTKDCTQDTEDIFGIKRSGDWEQVLAAKHTGDTMSTVLGSIDRLCILFSRMNRQPCILIDLKSEGLTCYRFNNNPNILLRAARTIKDKIDEILPMLDSISTDKNKLITFIDGRIEHLKKAKEINFNTIVPNADVIKNLIIEKLITELESIKITINANRSSDEANLRDNMLKSLIWLNNLRLGPNESLITEYESENFKISSNDAGAGDSLEYTPSATASASATEPINIIEKCNEIKTKFTDQQDYEKKFKDLDIKIDENGEYLVWGIVDETNRKFLRPTAKKPGPKLYDYQLLSDFCKGVLTIQTYNKANRRTSILDYGNEMQYFFIATRKLLDNLFPEGAPETPISTALKELSIFYVYDIISDKKQLNDTYMEKAKIAIEQITTPPLEGVSGQVVGGSVIQCENYIHQINWYVINEMAALEQTLYNIPNVEPTKINNDIEKFIFERLEEIFIKTESKYLTFLNYCSFLNIYIDPNSDSITVLKTLLFIIKFNYKFNERYERYYPRSSSSSQNLFPTNYFTEVFNSILAINDTNSDEVNYPLFFLTLNNIFITMTRPITDPIKIKIGFYESDIENFINKFDKNEYNQNLIIKSDILNRFVDRFVEINNATVITLTPVPALIAVRSTATTGSQGTGVTTQETLVSPYTQFSQSSSQNPPQSPIQGPTSRQNLFVSPESSEAQFGSPEAQVGSPEAQFGSPESSEAQVGSPYSSSEAQVGSPESSEALPPPTSTSTPPPKRRKGGKKYTIKNKMTKKTSRNSKKYRKTKNNKIKNKNNKRTRRKNK